MRFENIAIIFSLILIFTVSCTYLKQIDTANSCILIDSKKAKKILKIEKNQVKKYL